MRRNMLIQAGEIVRGTAILIAAYEKTTVKDRN